MTLNTTWVVGVNVKNELGVCKGSRHGVAMGLRVLVGRNV